MARTITTYSIAACDLDANQWGVATQSKFLAVGSVVPWAEPQVGAIATQAYANPRYGPQGLRLLREGLAAEEVVERLTSGDEGRDHRQLGVVDREGRSASFTGAECLEWAGGRTGPCYAAQGNILVSAATVDAIAELARIYELHEQLFGRTPRRFWLPLEGELRAEVDEQLGRLGYDSLDAWAGVENLEERVDGDGEIDPVVLDALREASS